MFVIGNAIDLTIDVILFLIHPIHLISRLSIHHFHSHQSHHSLLLQAVTPDLKPTYSGDFLFVTFRCTVLYLFAV